MRLHKRVEERTRRVAKWLSDGSYGPVPPAVDVPGGLAILPTVDTYSIENMAPETAHTLANALVDLALDLDSDESGTWLLLPAELRDHLYVLIGLLEIRSRVL